MLIFPAIDLYEGKAVRLYKGDYEQMTVYSDSPIELVEDFVEQGAKHLHLIDLEGAKTGKTPNLELIRDIRALSPRFTQVGGGIRSMDVVDAYLGAGARSSATRSPWAPTSKTATLPSAAGPRAPASTPSPSAAACRIWASRP